MPCPLSLHATCHCLSMSVPISGSLPPPKPAPPYSLPTIHLALPSTPTFSCSLRPPPHVLSPAKAGAELLSAPSRMAHLRGTHGYRECEGDVGWEGNLQPVPHPISPLQPSLQFVPSPCLPLIPSPAPAFFFP